MMMIKENQIAVSGRVSGVWNNQERRFEIKTGTSKGGEKYSIFEISVSKPPKEGEPGAKWVNGKGQKVILWGNITVEENSMIGVVGKLQPDNFTTADGKEIRGNQVVADEKDLFTPEKWPERNNESPAAGSSETVTETSEPANEEGNLPF
jgi:single-stranded DNA-binding protein